jgi:hypothetical protein
LCLISLSRTELLPRNSRTLLLDRRGRAPRGGLGIVSDFPVAALRSPCTSEKA